MAGESDPVRTAEAADVYKAGRLAARLRRTGAAVEFGYVEQYLRNPGPAVATTLPISAEPLLTVAGSVPTYFAGLLPEGRRLSGLRRAVKTSADDELSLVVAVGGDPVGDVQVVPSGEQPAGVAPLVSVERSFAEVSFADILRDSRVDLVAIAGVQDKASARMITVPVERVGRRYLLKVDPPEYPHVVANEHYFLTVASAGRIPCVRSELVHDADGRPGLLVERFDRVPRADGMTDAWAVEDGTQVLDRYPADKYNVTTEELVIGLSDWCAARAVAARSALQQVCFAYLTGNGDLHAKNMSILAVDGVEWRLAPAYDLPSTLMYEDTTLALPVGGRRTNLSRRAMQAFGAEIGLPDPVVERVIDQVLGATSAVEDDLLDGVLPFPPQVLRSAARVVRRRRRDLTG